MIRIAVGFDQREAVAYHTFTLDFQESQWAVTPGQSAVLYAGPVCLGGGIIQASGGRVSLNDSRSISLS